MRGDHGRRESPASAIHPTACSRDVFPSTWPNGKTMTIMELSLTGNITIRASHRHVARNCISSHCGRVFNLMCRKINQMFIRSANADPAMARIKRWEEEAAHDEECCQDGATRWRPLGNVGGMSEVMQRHLFFVRALLNFIIHYNFNDDSFLFEDWILKIEMKRKEEKT